MWPARARCAAWGIRRPDARLVPAPRARVDPADRSADVAPRDRGVALHARPRGRRGIAVTLALRALPRLQAFLRHAPPRDFRANSDRGRRAGGDPGPRTRPRV